MVSLPPYRVRIDVPEDGCEPHECAVKDAGRHGHDGQGDGEHKARQPVQKQGQAQECMNRHRPNNEDTEEQHVVVPADNLRRWRLLRMAIAAGVQLWRILHR